MDIFFLISAHIFQVVIWPPTRLFLWFFGHLEVKGLENLTNLPKDKGVIFASNHSSELDPFITPASLPFMSRFIPLYYTIREKSFYDGGSVRQKFYGGFIFRFIGGHYVYTGLKDYDKSLVNHIRLLKENKNIFVFPEGGISRIGKPKEAKGGIVYLAEKGNTLIIPVGISGLYGATMVDILLRKRRIIVTFGMPISQQELKLAVPREEDGNVNIYKDEAQYVMSKIGAII